MQDQNIPHGYCHCGCGRKTNIVSMTNAKLGRVKGEPSRYLIGHHRRTATPQYAVDPATSCWVWQRSTTLHGYGQLTYGGRNRLAHRVYYERHVGPIPEGLTLDHLCRNRRCVNPAHLEPVTLQENLRRGKHAYRQERGLLPGQYAHWAKGKQRWRGHVKIGDQRYHVGYFRSKEEALAATRRFLEDRA